MAPDDQPLPTPNDRPSIQAAVRADLELREQVGIERYGTPLQAHNGRDALRDAYEEALDLACYLRQAIAERDGPSATPAALSFAAPLDAVARLKSWHGSAWSWRCAAGPYRLDEQCQYDHDAVDQESAVRQLVAHLGQVHGIYPISGAAS